jgi:hypothetical protein
MVRLTGTVPFRSSSDQARSISSFHIHPITFALNMNLSPSGDSILRDDIRCSLRSSEERVGSYGSQYNYICRGLN